MTDATNDEARVAEIRGRCDAATEGPWIVESRSDGLAVGTPKTWYPQETYALVYSSGTPDDPMSGWTAEAINREVLNADFIAHARTDVPWLLARLEESNSQRDRYKAAVEAVLGVHCDSGSDLNSRPGETWCSGCGNRRWPCPTVKAVTEALGGEL